jgi:uncharacterized OsmC-like protein
MGEHVIVRQDSLFETEILAQDPHDPDIKALEPVGSIHHLTPYGMLLAGLGSCTAIVLYTYAQYHDVALDKVELQLEYDRIFEDDCQDCEGIEEYKEQIAEQITLVGDLTAADRKKLFAISKHCPIHQMLLHGIEVRSSLAPNE